MMHNNRFQPTSVRPRLRCAWARPRLNLSVGILPPDGSVATPVLEVRLIPTEIDPIMINGPSPLSIRHRPPIIFEGVDDSIRKNGRALLPPGPARRPPNPSVRSHPFPLSARFVCLSRNGGFVIRLAWPLPLTNPMPLVVASTPPCLKKPRI